MEIYGRKEFREVFTEVARELTSARDRNGNILDIHSIMAASSSGETYEYFFKERGTLCELRSLSKTVIGLTIGIAMEKGLYLNGQKVTLDTPIWPYFRDLVNLTNKGNLPRLEKVKLRHLLTHTIGHEVGLMFSKKIKDIPPERLLDYIWNTDMTHDPGELFVYSNAGPFLISVLIQEGLGMNLSEWVRDLLFEPLEIKKFEWRKYGKYCAGSTGLKLSHEDLHKLALLFLKDGMYDNRQIVPKGWIDDMRTPKARMQRVNKMESVLQKYSYGYYLWIDKEGNYFADGTNGQYLIVLPAKRTAITVLSNQEDMKPIKESIRPFLQ